MIVMLEIGWDCIRRNCTLVSHSLVLMLPTGSNKLCNLWYFIDNRKKKKHDKDTFCALFRCWFIRYFISDCKKEIFLGHKKNEFFWSNVISVSSDVGRCQNRKIVTHNYSVSSIYCLTGRRTFEEEVEKCSTFYCRNRYIWTECNIFIRLLNYFYHTDDRFLSQKNRSIVARDFDFSTQKRDQFENWSNHLLLVFFFFFILLYKAIFIDRREKYIIFGLFFFCPSLFFSPYI